MIADVLRRKSNERFKQDIMGHFKKHRGHQVYITSYGDPEHPANICLECEDCGEVVLDAELYTICAREDASSKGL